MALGTVSVRNQNLGQGSVAAIENHFLFIGPATKNVGKLVALNTQSDLDAELGVAASDLKTQIAAARANGGDRWACIAAPIAVSDGVWSDALEQAMRESIQVEGVVITTPAIEGSEFERLHAEAEAINNQYGRRVFVMVATAGIAEGQIWADYLSEQRALTDSIAAAKVMAVPQLHGNNLGVLAGRLATAAASVADSPMRVQTGPVIGLGPTPVDADGILLDMAVLAELDKARLSVPQTYSDYPGTFWGDGNMLDAPGSDFQVIEHVRIVDKAARRIRILLIQRVADRKVNNTPASMANTKKALMAPLRQMARSVVVNGMQIPGDIEPPKDEDLVIHWASKNAVVCYFTLRPYNNPKDLTASIALDLSDEEE